jgi:uncharacterized protein with HEPN domain
MASMPSNRPVERLQDVADNCERILRYTAGMSYADYLSDERTADAVERCLQRISEACYKLGDRLDTQYPDVPWQAARGIGNILRHKYDEISTDEIWSSIQNDIPLLLAGARKAIQSLLGEASSEP